MMLAVSYMVDLDDSEMEMLIHYAQWEGWVLPGMTPEEICRFVLFKEGYVLIEEMAQMIRDHRVRSAAHSATSPHSQKA